MHKTNFKVGDSIMFETQLVQENKTRMCFGRVMGVYKNHYAVMTPFGYVTSVNRLVDEVNLKKLKM